MLVSFMLSDYYSWIFALCVAFIPAILYGYYIWTIEKYYREPFRYVAVIFIWGGLISLLFLFVTQLIYGELLREQEYYALDKSYLNILLLCMVLPLFAEAIKLMGLPLVKTELDEVEDGLIYGALGGLGFAAIANFVYLKNAFVLDPTELGIVAIPSLSFAYLHASAGALVGYGVSRWYVEGERKYLLPYFLGGMVIHGGFIAFSIVSHSLKATSFLIYLIGLGIVLILSWAVFKTIRARMIKLIRELDEETEKERKGKLAEEE